ELAGHNIDGVTVEYNLSDDVDKFVGGGDMAHLRVTHNTVIRTREPNADPYVFWTFNPDKTSLEVRDNIFVLAPGLRVFDPIDRQQPGHQRTGIGEQSHDHNVYFISPDVRVDAAGVAALRAAGGDRAAAALRRTEMLTRARSANTTTAGAATTTATPDPIGLPPGPGDKIADPQFL